LEFLQLYLALSRSPRTFDGELPLARPIYQRIEVERGFDEKSSTLAICKLPSESKISWGGLRPFFLAGEFKTSEV